MGKFSKVTASKTRPANATQMTAGDDIGCSAAPFPFIFSDVVENTGEGGLIVDALCVSSVNAATKPNARLYLFDGPIAGSSDNAAHAPSDAEAKSLIGYVDFSSWEVGIATASAAGNAASFQSGLNIPFKPSGIDATPSFSKKPALWGQLVERGTYTPIASEEFTVRLGILRE